MGLTVLFSNIGSVRSIRKFGFGPCPSSPLLQTFRIGHLSNCKACVTDRPRFVSSLQSVNKSLLTTCKTTPRYNGFTKTSVRHASSGTEIIAEKPKLVTPKISKYRVDCNTPKVIKRAKNKKQKAAKPVPTLSAKERPAVVATITPKRTAPAAASTAPSSKNTPTAIPPRVPAPKVSFSTPNRTEAPGATWDALAALLKVDPMESTPLQDTVKTKPTVFRPIMPPGADDMAGSTVVRRRPSLAPPKIARSVYRTILDWSVHPTVQPNDFNITVDYGSTALSAPSRLKSSSAMASSTLGSSSRSESATVEVEGQNDFTAKRTRSRRRIGFENLDAEIEKTSSSISGRGDIREQDRSHSFPRVYLKDDKREIRTRAGADIAAKTYTITPPASPSPSAASPSPSPLLTSPPSPAVGSSRAAATPLSPFTGISSSLKPSTTAVPVVENRDYLYSPNCVLPALTSTLRKSYTLYHTARSLSQGNLEAVEVCIEAAQKAKVKVVQLDRRRLDALAGNGHHEGVVLEASRLRKMTIKTIGPVSEDGRYELQFKKNYKPVEGEQQPLIIPATTQGSPPLWIAMDELTDPTVMGEIVKNASYFGVDGLIIRSKNSAPLSPIVSEASAGALEIRPVYSVDSLVRLIQTSQGNGWHVAGARITYGAKRGLPLYMWPSAGIEKPTILVLGNDADGVSDQTKKQCDSLVQVPSLCQIPWGTNSLEGGVFAGMVMARLLAGRLQQRKSEMHA
ncbi:hypothetical protein BGZ70_000285 [Mortierella alpina]|uniref:rRNA methyltransferase 1, mitochondrial n=1 Tax=Mortierella alpina TaxID=64518 RepID=A0A9P6JCF9_MORAP|nr:hypothetical protein BGZ70_000285 [Mortierella alpina]